jgi:hypothetical protein
MTPQASRETTPIHTATTPTAPPLGILQPSALPAWESFPLADRRLLVSAIVQTARRRIPNQPANQLVPAKG